MHILEKLFGQSPFGPLMEHAKKVEECIDLLLPTTEAWLKEDWAELERMLNAISEAERRADEIKIKIRRILPKGYLYAVPRGGILRILQNQDSMADSAEDYAVMLTLRKTILPESLRDEFRDFLEKVVRTCKQALSSVEQLDVLVETSFSGPAAEKVLAAVEEVGEMEWEVDLLARSLGKKLLSLEDKVPTLDIIFCRNIMQILSHLCNHAENSGDNLCHLIVSRT